MGRLSHKDVEKVANALLELHSHQNFQTLPQHLIAVTRKLVPVDISTYNEIDGGTNELRAVHDYPGDAEKHFPAFMAHLHQHPIVNHATQTGDTSPVLNTDFVTQRRFERTALFNEFYKVFGIRHQAAFFLPKLAGFQVAIGLQRLRTPFTETDRAMLRLLSPHVSLVWRNTRTLAQARQAQAKGSSGQAHVSVEQVVLDGGWRVRECSERATVWMQRHFNVVVRPERKLPELFLNWLARMSSPVPEELLGGGLGGALVSRGANESLEIAWMPESPLKSHLNLICQTHLKSFDSPLQFGLTTREAQVLSWLLEGKTNPEIGAILGRSVNTVRKHLEHIYAKLGVENRLAAMRMLREVVKGDN
jgi:DNA-binding CsgD family transcriptional regulator